MKLFKPFFLLKKLLSALNLAVRIKKNCITIIHFRSNLTFLSYITSCVPFHVSYMSKT